jgi:2-oxoglutarate ferredoxin oxidoreductase subunit delta
MTDRVLTRGTVTIDVEKCKGCDLCIPACRPGVLQMTNAPQLNSVGFRYPLLAPGCTACRACFEVCPDSVFEVYRYEVPIEIDIEPDL